MLLLLLLLLLLLMVVLLGQLLLLLMMVGRVRKPFTVAYATNAGRVGLLPAARLRDNDEDTTAGSATICRSIVDATTIGPTSSSAIVAAHVGHGAAHRTVHIAQPKGETVEHVAATHCRTHAATRRR